MSALEKIQSRSEPSNEDRLLRHKYRIVRVCCQIKFAERRITIVPFPVFFSILNVCCAGNVQRQRKRIAVGKNPRRRRNLFSCFDWPVLQRLPRREKGGQAHMTRLDFAIIETVNNSALNFCWLARASISLNYAQTYVTSRQTEKTRAQQKTNMFKLNCAHAQKKRS